MSSVLFARFAARASALKPKDAETSNEDKSSEGQTLVQPVSLLPCMALPSGVD